MRRDPTGAIVARYERGNGDGAGDEPAVALWVWRVLYGDGELTPLIEFPNRDKGKENDGQVFGN